MLDPNHGPIIHRVFMDLVDLTVIGTGSFLIWKYYDHPINRLRAEWVRRRKVSKPELSAAGGNEGASGIYDRGAK